MFIKRCFCFESDGVGGSAEDEGTWTTAALIFICLHKSSRSPVAEASAAAARPHPAAPLEGDPKLTPSRPASTSPAVAWCSRHVSTYHAMRWEERPLLGDGGSDAVCA